MNVIKRNGTEVPFDLSKIQIAITKANNSVPEEARMTELQIRRITESVEFSCLKMNRSPSVEEIQDKVEYQIMAHGAYEVSKNYITYRYNRSLIRRSNTTDDRILSLIDCSRQSSRPEDADKTARAYVSDSKGGKDPENAANNPILNSAQRDYMAGEVSRDLTERILLPKDIVDAHREGMIHFHDAAYFAQHMHNCDLVNLDDMLQNGTVISGTLIEKPHSFSTACSIATQIIAQIASNQYGGQAISLAHLAPFVDISRKRIRKEAEAEMEKAGVTLKEETISELVENRLREEIRRGVQTIQYQVITLLTANGHAPFISVFMYLGEAASGQEKADLAMIMEELLRTRIQGVKNESGEFAVPAFPKLVYVLEEDNVTKDAQYWYLTELAAACSAKGMFPEFISEKKMRERKGDVLVCMDQSCFLTPDRFSEEGIGNIANAGNYEPGKRKYYGRFNQGIVTINLADAALSSGGDKTKFWNILEERLELCHRALKLRHERLLGTLSDVAPILWQHGALARLKKGEVIDPLLKHGYSTLSLGYAGLCECVKYMTGKSHLDIHATPFGLEVMQKMNDKCLYWRKEEDIDYILDGNPSESTSRKFATALKRRFGTIKEITDQDYVTNHNAVPFETSTNLLTRLETQSRLQALSPGGVISYAEITVSQNRPDLTQEIIRFIYDHLIYAGVKAE